MFKSCTGFSSITRSKHWGAMWVPGSRPNRGMDIVPSRSHHSPRSRISVSYCMTVVTHVPGLLVVVSSDIVPWQEITAERNARLVSRTHTLSSPSSLMVVLVESSVPILYQNLACPPRYPVRKGKCCRCRVEPGVLPTYVPYTTLGFWTPYNIIPGMCTTANFSEDVPVIQQK